MSDFDKQFGLKVAEIDTEELIEIKVPYLKTGPNETPAVFLCRNGQMEYNKDLENAINADKAKQKTTQEEKRYRVSKGGRKRMMDENDPEYQQELNQALQDAGVEIVRKYYPGNVIVGWMDVYNFDGTEAEFNVDGCAHLVNRLCDKYPKIAYSIFLDCVNDEHFLKTPPGEDEAKELGNVSGKDTEPK